MASVREGVMSVTPRATSVPSAELKTFIDRVIVPTLTERFLAQQSVPSPASSDAPPQRKAG